jgi:hypothetical protein
LISPGRRVLAVAIGCTEVEAVVRSRSDTGSWSKSPPFVACEKYHKPLPTASRVNSVRHRNTETQKFFLGCGEMTLGATQ